MLTYASQLLAVASDEGGSVSIIGCVVCNGSTLRYAAYALSNYWRCFLNVFLCPFACFLSLQCIKKMTFLSLHFHFLIFSCQVRGKWKWSLIVRWISILTVVDLSQTDLNSPAYQKSSRSSFALKRACSIPQSPPWCLRLWRNSDEYELNSIPPPSLSTHMFMMRWAWHAPAFILFPTETLIWPAATCNLSILASLKGV